MTESEAIKRCDMLIHGLSVNNAISEAFNDENKGYVTFEAMSIFAETCKDALEKVQQFEAIGTIERFRELTEKAEPKNAFVEGSYLLDDMRYFCPKCKERLYTEHFDVGYCNCGQAVK